MLRLQAGAALVGGCRQLGLKVGQGVLLLVQLAREEPGPSESCILGTTGENQSRQWAGLGTGDSRKGSESQTLAGFFVFSVA